MIKFGIIGYGNIGKRHAEHIINNSEAILVGICDNDKSKQEDIANLGVTYWDKEAQFFENIEADIICICTPNYLHAVHAISAIKNNKHVIVEKPLGLNAEECNDMIITAKSYNKNIFAVKQNRYNPPVQLAKECIINNDLGNIFLVQINCFWNRNDSYYSQSSWRGSKTQDGGCLFTQFSHFIDILYYLVGEVNPIQGVIENYLHHHNTEFEDTGCITLKGENNALINFSFTTCSYEKNMEGSITIFGEIGTIKIGGQYLNTIEYSNIENKTLPTINIQAKENDYGTYKGSMSNHDKVIQNAVDVLMKRDTIMTTAEEGKKVVEIIEKMYNVCI